MRERAQLFGGNVEAKIVPGIGFTINAIFPNIDDLTAGQE
jgi:signal transduction histidine kinase